MSFQLWVVLGVVASAVGGLAVYDLWLYLTGGDEATLSWQMLTLALEHPIIPIIAMFLFGVLVGHTWWPQYMVRK